MREIIWKHRNVRERALLEYIMLKCEIIYERKAAELLSLRGARTAHHAGMCNCILPPSSIEFSFPLVFHFIVYSTFIQTQMNFSRLHTRFIFTRRARKKKATFRSTEITRVNPFSRWMGSSFVGPFNPFTSAFLKAENLFTLFVSRHSRCTSYIYMWHLSATAHVFLSLSLRASLNNFSLASSYTRTRGECLLGEGRESSTEFTTARKVR